MTTWISIIISGLSLVIAIISFCESHRANKLQARINELEIQIKEHNLNSIKQSEIEKKAALIEARMIDVGNRGHKLRVWNSGKSTAYNVSVDYDKSEGLILLSEDLLPFEELYPGKNFDITVIVPFESSKKFRVMLNWEDSNGIKQNNKMLLSI